MRCEYLSASSAETYEACPLRYYARYELNFKSGMDTKVGAGLITHKALEIYYNPAKQPTPEEAFLAASCREECRDQEMFEKAKQEFMETVNSEDRDSLNVIGTEIGFTMFTPGGAAARGFIDRLDMVRDDTLQVVDYKTGNYIPTMEDLIVGHQSRLYPLWIFMNPDFSDIKHVTVRYIYTKTGESKTLPPVTLEKSKRYMDYFEHLFHSIKRNEKPLPLLNQFCYNCEYRGDCSEYLNLMKVAHVMATGEYENIPKDFKYTPTSFDDLVELYDRLSKAETILEREKKNTGMRLSSVLKYNNMDGQIVNGKSVKLMSKKMKKCNKDSIASIIKEHGLESKALERISVLDMEAITKGNKSAMKALELASVPMEGVPYPMIRKLKTKDGKYEKETQDTAGQ